jgi:hypothetical protein
MPEVEFSLDDVDGGTASALIRLDDGILEVFQRGLAGSLRVPVAWCGVQVEPKKHDRVLLSIGEQNVLAGASLDVLYGLSVRVLGGPRYLHISAADQPAARMKFQRIALAAGRAVEP